MKIIIIEPGKQPKSVTVSEKAIELRRMQQIVQGQIEVVHADGMPKGTVIICNEEGKLLDLAKNFEIQRNGVADVICGTAMICADDGEDLVALDETTAEKVLMRMQFNTPERKKCCLCGQFYEGEGYNATPLRAGRCCGKCFSGLVTPERTKRMIKNHFCQNYCKWPDKETLGGLGQHCQSCPLYEVI